MSRPRGGPDVPAADPAGRRLDALRRSAEAGGDRRAEFSSLPAIDYAARPIVKPPVWTWEVPLYFFLGGLAGMAAVVAMAAWGAGGGTLLVRDALRLAAGGAALCPLLLISDLGRPRRFLNMLRVVKFGSPMSVGAWTLVIFQVLVIVCWLLVERYEDASRLLGAAARPLVHGLLLPAALAGALLAVYTGVLLAATAIPAWAAQRAVLPVHFGAAAMGSAVAALELLGHRIAALQHLGMAVAAVETVLLLLWLLGGHGARSLSGGAAGRLARRVGVAAVLTGPLNLLLRGLAPVRPGLLTVAAVTFLAGALASRFAWIALGRAAAARVEPDRGASS